MSASYSESRAILILWSDGGLFPVNLIYYLVSLLVEQRVFQEVCQEPFHFVYVSGARTERDHSKSL
ncbi:hypothetical protein N7490_008302 [Penicillium lividum]|nr:hypothetical protein N7490_008302 [Penicillium lividum]